MFLTIHSSGGHAPGEEVVEVVERKGLGHREVIHGQQGRVHELRQALLDGQIVVY